MSSLILKRASASRSSGQWRDDYDVLENSVVVGRIFLFDVLGRRAAPGCERGILILAWRGRAHDFIPLINVQRRP
jgi:hypothetical protein